jgi:hypothetical protein
MGNRAYAYFRGSGLEAREILLRLPVIDVKPLPVRHNFRFAGFSIVNYKFF